MWKLRSGVQSNLWRVLLLVESTSQLPKKKLSISIFIAYQKTCDGSRRFLQEYATFGVFQGNTKSMLQQDPKQMEI